MEQNNNNNRSFKIITVIALCVAVLCLSVAYAALSQQLNIRGNASVQAANWDIHFANFETSTTGAAQISHTSKENSTAVSGLNITLTKPGDSATLKFNIVNAGDINAVLKTLTQAQKLTCTGSASDPTTKSSDEQIVCEDVVYEFKYQDSDTDVSLEDTLDSGETKGVYLKLTYKSSADDLPTDAVNITGLDKTLVYNQKISPTE